MFAKMLVICKFSKKELFMVNPVVIAPIIGARYLNQLEDSLAAADFKMTVEMYAEISGCQELLPRLRIELKY
jgi:hypothetical protein